MNQLLFLCFFILFGNAQAGELYRFVDSSGHVLYSDTPPEDPDDATHLKMSVEATPEPGLPYETQKALKDFPVTLYVFPNCSKVCQQARDCLSQRGIPYTEKSLASQDDIDAFRKISGSIDVPALTIGRTWVKGFQAEQWNRELDFAGYPKTAPYHPRAAKPGAHPAR